MMTLTGMLLYRSSNSTVLEGCRIMQAKIHAIYAPPCILCLPFHCVPSRGYTGLMDMSTPQTKTGKHASVSLQLTVKRIYYLMEACRKQ